jgi:anti-sigma B factor antagonist
VKIGQRTVENVTILDLEGRLVAEDGFEPLRQTLNRLIADGRTNVLLNMDRVIYLDSAGIGLIACKYVTLNRHNGHLKLCNLHLRSHEVLNVTKLLTVFEAFDSESDAIRSF